MYNSIDLEILVEAVKDDGLLESKDSLDDSLYSYYHNRLDELIAVTLIKLDKSIKRSFPTIHDLYKWFNEDAGNNISLERIRCYDINFDDFSDDDHLMLLYSMFEDSFGFLTWHSMTGDGIGWFEMFDCKLPNLHCIV